MASAFIEALREANSQTPRETWVYIAYDQLNATIGPLSRLAPTDVGIVLIENPHKAARRPYHKQKLALILANMRHFALEQASRGVRVDYRVATESYASTLREVAEHRGPLVAMVPAERELRVELAPLEEEGLLDYVPHGGWLTTPEHFRTACGDAPWRMDAFYRHVRQETGYLMEDGSPIGGRYSFDGDNRKPWPGEPAAPTTPTFTPDAITREVGELIMAHFAHHPGTLDLSSLPATAADAEAFWMWAIEACMPLFGPYEDAMSRHERTLFHSRVSQLVNIHRLLPRRLVDDVHELDIPIASKEGFIRQVLGWREFMRHVHEETDGLRVLPGIDRVPVTESPGDGGWSRWQGDAWPASRSGGLEDGGAAPSVLDAHRPLPPAFWGEPSGMTCLDTVVESVWDEAYSHHITRLMVLGNIATLLDIEPRELTDWFWVAYSDAFDWVVEPNVLGMATFGVGELFTTKPYVSGSNYIDKMSDYCGDCAFHPKKTCPLKRLYWAFLARHEDALAANPRMSLIFGALRRRSDAQRSLDERTFVWVAETLDAGERLRPVDAPRT